MHNAQSLTPEEREQIFLEELARRADQPTVVMRAASPPVSPAAKAHGPHPSADYGQLLIGIGALVVIGFSCFWIAAAVKSSSRDVQPLPPLVGPIPKSQPKVEVRPLYGSPQAARADQSAQPAPTIQLRQVAPSSPPATSSAAAPMVQFSGEALHKAPPADGTGASSPMFTETPQDDLLPKVSITNLTKFRVTLVLKRNGMDAVRFSADPLNRAWVSAPEGEYAAELQSDEPGVELGRGSAVLRAHRAYEAVVIVHTVKGKERAPGFEIGRPDPF
jgi:hypothetical protein